MSIVYFVFGFVLGGAVGHILTHRQGQKLLRQADSCLADMNAERTAQDARLAMIDSAKSALETRVNGLSQELASTKERVVAVETARAQMEQRLHAEESLRKQFAETQKAELRANAEAILNSQSQEFSKNSKVQLDTLLAPFKDSMEQMKKKMEETYVSETRERYSLKAVVEKLTAAHDATTKVTTEFTQVLRGDSKVQGDWGEITLEKLLQDGGLVENVTYFKQETHEDDKGGKFRPDYKVVLPTDKHFILDSKVSLKSYEEYRQATDDEGRQTKVGALLKSMVRHIDDLSSKHYSRLKGVSSPDLVFMFIPNEAAYFLAVKSDPSLIQRAWLKGVAIVTATTLFSALKSVSHAWRVEGQNRNVAEIFEEFGKAYDQMALFLESYMRLGKFFTAGQDVWNEGLGRLRDGRGNVLRRMERIRELGANPKKLLPVEV